MWGSDTEHRAFHLLMYSCGKGKLSNWEKDLLTILRRNAKGSSRHGKQDGNLSLLWHIQSLRVTGKGSDLELNTPVGFKFSYVNGFFNVISKKWQFFRNCIRKFQATSETQFFLQSVLAAPVVESVLLLTWRCTTLLSSVLTSAPPCLFWVRQKWLWRVWLSLFSVHTLSTLFLANLGVSPWWHISTSNFSLRWGYSQPSFKCAGTAVWWWAWAILRLSLVRVYWAPCGMTRSYNWKILSLGESLSISVYFNVLSCADTSVLPRLFRRSAPKKKCTQL